MLLQLGQMLVALSMTGLLAWSQSMDLFGNTNIEIVGVKLHVTVEGCVLKQINQGNSNAGDGN